MLYLNKWCVLTISMLGVMQFNRIIASQAVVMPSIQTSSSCSSSASSMVISLAEGSSTASSTEASSSSCSHLITSSSSSLSSGSSYLRHDKNFFIEKFNVWGEREKKYFLSFIPPVWTNLVPYVQKKFYLSHEFMQKKLHSSTGMSWHNAHLFSIANNGDLLLYDTKTNNKLIVVRPQLMSSQEDKITKAIEVIALNDGWKFGLRDRCKFYTYSDFPYLASYAPVIRNCPLPGMNALNILGSFDCNSGKITVITFFSKEDAICAVNKNAAVIWRERPSQAYYLVSGQKKQELRQFRHGYFGFSFALDPCYSRVIYLSSADVIYQEIDGKPKVLPLSFLCQQEYGGYWVNCKSLRGNDKQLNIILGLRFMRHPVTSGNILLQIKYNLEDDSIDVNHLGKIFLRYSLSEVYCYYNSDHDLIVLKQRNSYFANSFSNVYHNCFAQNGLFEMPDSLLGSPEQFAVSQNCRWAARKLQSAHVSPIYPDESPTFVWQVRGGENDLRCDTTHPLDQAFSCADPLSSLQARIELVHLQQLYNEAKQLRARCHLTPIQWFWYKFLLHKLKDEFPHALWKYRFVAPDQPEVPLKDSRKDVFRLSPIELQPD